MGSSWTPSITPTTASGYACKIRFTLNANDGISKLYMTFCDANNWNTQEEKRIDATNGDGDFPFDLEQNCA